MSYNRRTIELSGQKFGGWTVISRAGRDVEGKATWLARCLCGTQRVVRGYDLRAGKSANCGCVVRSMLGNLKRSHGASRTRLHTIWSLMKRRCTNTNLRSYANYGGRGITVCAEWARYEPFRDWAEANGYSADLSIDRIDNNAGYSPNNCRWATSAAQSKNRRNVHVTADGRVAIDVARANGISIPAYKGRIRRGWSVDDAVREPMRR